MALIENMSDSEIRSKLAEFGHPVGPVTETTRKVLVKKLGLLMREKKEAKQVRRNIVRYSSGEWSSDNEEHGGVRHSKKISMPPPVNFRSRRKSNPKNSMSNTSLGDVSSSSITSSFSSFSTSTRRSNVNKSLRKSAYDFDSGSDSDVNLNSSFKNRPSKQTLPKSPRKQPSLGGFNDVRGSTSLTASQKEPRPFLSNLTKRLSKIGNDVNNIKETDVDETPSYFTRPFSYRLNPSPTRSIYERPTLNEKKGIGAQLQQWGPMLLLSLFLLFIVWVAATYCSRAYFQAPLIVGKQNNVYPICADHEFGTGRCIPADDLQFAVSLYRTVHQLLLARSVQSVCGPALPDGSTVKPYMTQRELVQYLLKSQPEDVLRVESGVKHLGLLLVSNPHWGVAVLRADDGEAPPTAHCNIADGRKALPSDLAINVPMLFIAPRPYLSFSCRAKLFLYSFIYYLLASAMASGISYGFYAGTRYYLKTVKEEEEQVMNLVERILRQITESCNCNQEYISMRHVHDMLIPPAERPRMLSLWEKAVAFIEKNESRVRREIQTVFGEETAVWRLLTQVPSPSPSPSLPSPISPATPDPADNHLYPDLSSQVHREGQRVWQGEAFETSEGSMNSLPVSPSPCLKIRHMFQPNKHYRGDWETTVRDAIIEKCEGVEIVHIRLVADTKEGCVFLKCSSLQQAGEAYRKLHGSWFDGALVTVKYLRLERYHERFPDSVNCKTPLQPSNNLRLSMGGRKTIG